MKFLRIKNIFLTAIAGSVTAFMSMSCKTAHQPDSTHLASQPRHDVTVTDGSYRADYAALSSAYLPWSDVKIPVNIKISSPASLSIGGTATLTANRSIGISLRMLGFEVASVMIDNDSIFATYKMQKRYVAESIPELLRGFPATVGNLQSLLLGHIFYPGADFIGETDASMFEFDSANDPDLPSAMLMKPRVDLNGAECVFVSDGETVPALLAFMAIAGRNQASAIYSQPVTTPAGPISPTCEINGTASGKTISARITFDLGKAKWNTGAAPRRPNTQGYRRISAASLLKSISTL